MTRHARGSYPPSHRREPPGPEIGNAEGHHSPGAFQSKHDVHRSHNSPASDRSTALPPSQRGKRELQALALLEQLTGSDSASALELGTTALRGELRAGRISRHNRSVIGLAIGISLVRRGLASVTAQNRFTRGEETGHDDLG